MKAAVGADALTGIRRTAVQEIQTPTIHATAIIELDENTSMGPQSDVGPYAFIRKGSIMGNVIIGAHAVIGPNVEISDDAVIGNNSSVTNGARVRAGCIVPPGMHICGTTLIHDVNPGSTPFTGELPEGHTLEWLLDETNGKNGKKKMVLGAVLITPSNIFHDTFCQRS